MPECSKWNEKCDDDGDRCPDMPDDDIPALKCLGGFCGFIVVD
jgi:hypothetical protein